MSEELSQLERDIAEALASADAKRAALLTLRGYGSEILGFLLAQLRNDQYAEEVFSMFAEDLWRSLAGLTLRSSMRAYAYALARHAKHRFLARDLRKQRAAVPLADAEISALVAEVRSHTATFLATESKQKLAALRDRLDADEQALLTLRVDRGLEWLEIAEVFGDEDLKKGAARYRKRFQQLKEKLARWAKEAGLIGPSAD